MTNDPLWKRIIAQKRQIRDQLLAPYLVDDVDSRLPRVDRVDERSRLDQEPKIQTITDIDSIALLLERLRKGEFTAEVVVHAYIKR
jgi:hypothetical protein